MLQSFVKGTTAYKTLLQDKNNDMLSHAYLINGGDAYLRELLLKEIALLIMCKQSGCRHCTLCNKILKGNHLDLKIVPLEQKIDVKFIDSLLEDTQSKSIEGGKKLYIINNAERMSIDVQNKLLKTYEEPNQNIIFILATGNDTYLLPTIKSRAKKIFLDDLPSDIIIQELTAQGALPKQAVMIASYAQGSLEKAQKMLQEQGYQEQFASTMEMILELKHSSQIIDYVFLPIFQKETIAMTLDFMEIIFSDVLRLSTGMPSRTNHEEYDLTKIAKRFSTAGVSMAILAINKGREMLHFHINTASVAEKIMFDILEAAHKWH